MNFLKLVLHSTQIQPAWNSNSQMINSSAVHFGSWTSRTDFHTVVGAWTVAAVEQLVLMVVGVVEKHRACHSPDWPSSVFATARGDLRTRPRIEEWGNSKVGREGLRAIYINERRVEKLTVITHKVNFTLPTATTKSSKGRLTKKGMGLDWGLLYLSQTGSGLVVSV